MRYIVILFCYIMCTLTAYAQGGNPLLRTATTRGGSGTSAVDSNYFVQPKLVATLYPFSFIASYINVGLEAKVRHNAGLRLNAAVGTAEESSYYEVDEFMSYYLEGQYRYYPLKRALNGVYVAPYAAYKAVSFKSRNDYFDPIFGAPVDEIDETMNASCYGGGVVFGYQLAYNFFVVDAYIGGGIYGATGDYKEFRNSGSTSKEWWGRGMYPNIGLNLGIVLDK